MSAALPKVIVDAAVHARLLDALTKAEIGALIDRYIVLLDTADDPDRVDEEYLKVFTEDVRLTFPIGRRSGVEGLADFQRQACRAWERTYHQSGNHLVELVGERAEISAQVLAVHIESGSDPIGVQHAQRLDVGGRYVASAVSTPDGWRIAALEFVITWTSGMGRPGKTYAAGPQIQERL